MHKYKLFCYDVWGNARNGFEVNDVYPVLRSLTGSILDADNVFIDLLDDDSNYKINRKLGLRGITWEPDYDYGTLYGTNKKNGKPIAELRLVKEEGN